MSSPRLRSDSWNQQHIGALCSAVANRQWPQARLVDANLAPGTASRACRLCVEHGLCTRDSQDRRFHGTLVHRLWTCPVLEPYRREHVPMHLYNKVHSMLREDGTLPPDHLLLYTRALHKSIEPQITKPPSEESFTWHVPPPSDGIPPGRVYADGSRLFAEHKYCDLIARQGWAFAVLDSEGVVIAAASGRTPWWAVGIHATELWALLNASQHACPGSPFFTDCKAVQVGTKNGKAWMTSPARKFGRAWSPLSIAIEGDEQAIIWMPAHCDSSSVGEASLSDGTKMTRIDRIGNDTVDMLAKADARQAPPSLGERRIIADTSNLVKDIAQWIGRCTVLANHFPFTSADGTKKHIRDSDAKKRVSRQKPLRGKLPVARPKPPSPNSVTSLLSVPSFSPQPSNKTGKPQAVFHDYATPILKGNRVPKRKRPTSKDAEDRENASFHTHWRAFRDQRLQLVTPTVSATDRLKALRERVLAKRNCGEASPNT